MIDPVARARGFRRAMSVAEIKLWYRLKKLRPQGFHIRRQAPFRGYYLDFVCFGRRLVIEVDGEQHAEDGQAAHDRARDGVLQREGFRVMRFWAGQIHNEIDDVMHAIMQGLEAAGPSHLTGAAQPRPTPRGTDN